MTGATGFALQMQLAAGPSHLRESTVQIRSLQDDGTDWLERHQGFHPTKGEGPGEYESPGPSG